MTGTFPVSLLSLPPELRLNIYEELFALTLHYRTSSTSKHVTIVEPCLPISLLQTCRTINAELTHLLHIKPLPKTPPKLIITLSHELEDPFKLLAVADAVYEVISHEKKAEWHIADPSRRIEILFVRDDEFLCRQDAVPKKRLSGFESFKSSMCGKGKQEVCWSWLEGKFIDEILRAAADGGLLLRVRLRGFDSIGKEVWGHVGIGFMVSSTREGKKGEAVRRVAMGDMFGRGEWERGWAAAM